MSQHLASVIVPCRNERDHIEAFVASALAQRLPPNWAIEVIVADGASDDGTRERLDSIAAHDQRLLVIDNPASIVSSGLNRALARARGEVIVRMDVHTTYADDYVDACLAALERSRADNVGGPWRAEGDTPRQRAIAAAFQSRWVTGGAKSRRLDYEGAVDTVYLGCWPRATFERYGEFDEMLVRNQDDEHNLRIVRGGGRVWQSPAIRSSYQPRGSLRDVFRQQLQYGYWKAFVMRKHGQVASLRQVVPGAFVAVVVLLVVAAWVWPPARSALGALAGAYALFALTAAAVVAGQAGWALWPRIALVVPVYHLGYGLGMLRGWADVLLRGTPSVRFGALTR